jgi:uncharacterized protein (UPF0332 family)
MDWKKCKDTMMVKNIKPDINLVKSLIKSAEKRLKSQELLELNDTTSESKVSLCYDALRELLEALAILKGFKVYNHECYCAFLKEVMKESTLGDYFDKQRKIRNSINYYGDEISVDEAKAVITQIKDLISKIKPIINEILK